MNIAVCEDEPLAMDALVGKIQAYQTAKQMDGTVSTFSDGDVLLAHLRNTGNHFDAIYLDIKMDRMNGIETAKGIRKTDANTCIVFVTALKEYVFDAFDVNATNFLLKPIDDNKLFSTLDQIARQLDRHTSRALIITTNGSVETIPFANIVYCEVLNHRLFVYQQDSMHVYGGKIEELETALNEDFFRCHRSYLVHFRFVERYRDGFIYLPSDEKIPVATRRRQAFMQAFLRFQRNEVR